MSNNSHLHSHFNSSLAKIAREGVVRAKRGKKKLHIQNPWASNRVTLCRFCTDFEHVDIPLEQIRRRTDFCERCAENLEFLESVEEKTRPLPQE